MASLNIPIRVDKRQLRHLDDMDRKLQQSETAAQKFGRSAATHFSRASGGVKAFASNLLNVNGLLVSLGAALGVVGLTRFAQSLIRPNIELQNMTAQFSTLMGSADAARRRLGELTDFAKRTPFDLPGVVQASRTLRVFGIDTDATLRTVGDAAAGTGEHVRELAMWFGRIKAGDFGEALRRFRELGVATTSDFLREGLSFDNGGQLVASGERAFAALERIVAKRFGGMMDVQSRTLGGMISNFRDWSFQARAQLGEGMAEAMRQGMGGLLPQLDELLDSGKLREWGARLGEGFTRGIELGKRFVEFGVNHVLPTLQDIGDVLLTIPDIIREGSVMDAFTDLGVELGKAIARGIQSVAGNGSGLTDAMTIGGGAWAGLKVGQGAAALRGAVTGGARGRFGGPWGALIGAGIGAGAVFAPDAGRTVAGAAASHYNRPGLNTDPTAIPVFVDGVREGTSALERFREALGSVGQRRQEAQANPWRFPETGPIAGIGAGAGGGTGELGPIYGGPWPMGPRDDPMRPTKFSSNPTGGMSGVMFPPGAGDLMAEAFDPMAAAAWADAWEEAFQRLEANMTTVQQMFFGVHDAIIDSMGNAVVRMVDSTMSGSEKVKAFAEDLKFAVVGSIVDTTTAWIKAEARRVFFSSKATEIVTANNAIEVSGSALVTAAKYAESQATTKSAAAKFFDAHAWIPFVGAGLAGAFVGYMVSQMSQFAHGTSAVRTVADDQLALVGRNENIMRASSAQSIGEDNLAFMNRTGRMPGGGGIGSVHLHISGDAAASPERLAKWFRDEAVPMLEDMVLGNRTNLGMA